MRTQKLRWGTGILLFTVFLATASFGQEIPLYEGLVRDAAMSDQALENWRKSLESLTIQLNMLKDEFPDQVAVINIVIAKIDEKLDNLLKIDVYTIDEDVAGDKFPAIRDFYKARMTLTEVDSAELKQKLEKETDGKDISSEMIELIFSIPQTSTDRLLELLDQNKFQAASGASGKSRISIMTVYVNPLDYTVMEGTTVVIATDR